MVYENMKKYEASNRDNIVNRTGDKWIIQDKENADPIIVRIKEKLDEIINKNFSKKIKEEIENKMDSNAYIYDAKIYVPEDSDRIFCLIRILDKEFHGALFDKEGNFITESFLRNKNYGEYYDDVKYKNGNFYIEYRLITNLSDMNKTTDEVISYIPIKINNEAISTGYRTPFVFTKRYSEHSQPLFPGKYGNIYVFSFNVLNEHYESFKNSNCWSEVIAKGGLLDLCLTIKTDEEELNTLLKESKELFEKEYDAEYYYDDYDEKEEKW